MRAFAYFRMATAIVTLALVVFVLWLGGDHALAKPIAAGVLIVGLLQWWGLGRMAQQDGQAAPGQPPGGD